MYSIKHVALKSSHVSLETLNLKRTTGVDRLSKARHLFNVTGFRKVGSVVVESKMTDQTFRPRARFVIGPDGSPLTIADLPPKNTRRWVIRRKAEVVAAVRGGLLSLEEACERYKLTVEEFLSWQRSIDKHGLAGLRATRIQDYRA